jgi:hypothetical protein
MAPFLGGQATILGSRPRFDFEAVFAIPKGHTHLLIESKQDSSHFGALRQQREPVFGHAYQTIPVLAMPIMSSRVAELCEVNDWSWFDLAGNCHIEVHFALIGEEMNPSIDRRVHKPISVLPLLGGSFEHCQLRKMQESGGPAQYRKAFRQPCTFSFGTGLRTDKQSHLLSSRSSLDRCFHGQGLSTVRSDVAAFGLARCIPI